MILFICSGNTCRSPMAKFIFNAELEKHSINAYTGDSAGLFCYAGEPISFNASEVLKESGIDSSSHKSKPASSSLLKKAHLLVCMTNSIKNTIQINFPEFTGKLRLMKFFSSDNTAVNSDVCDPFGRDLNIYRNIRDEIADCIKKMIILSGSNEL